MTEYTPSTELMRTAWHQYATATDAEYARLRAEDDSENPSDEFDRFLARVKRDAAREALDGLADGYASEPDIDEPEFECEAFVIQAARHYRDTHHPETED